MQTLILRSDSEEKIEKIIETANGLGISISKISKENIEDFGIALAIEKGKTGNYIDTDTFLNELLDEH